jgi:hypothetical protein
MTKMRRRVRFWMATLAVIVLVAASEAIVMILTAGLSRAVGGWSTTDLSTHVALPSGTAFGKSGVINWEVGNYYSDGLQIYGLICYPSSAGRHPVLIVNHGLDLDPSHAFTYPPYWAIVSNSWSGCVKMADSGWLVATSTYRGESIVGLPPAPNYTAVSQSVLPWWLPPFGGLELCGGEVDDVLNLVSAVDALPIANPNQVLMWGHSHGSCVTERAIERGAPVQIAVSLDGPTDFTTWKNNNLLIDPFPAQQQARSSAWPPNAPSNLANVKFLRIQAEGDQVVEPEQGCELAAVLPGTSNYYLDSNISPPGTFVLPPKECVPWPTPCYLDATGSHCGPWKLGAFGLLPDTGPGHGVWSSPTFLMYIRLDHGAIRNRSWPEFASFVNQFASRWNASIPSQSTDLE